MSCKAKFASILLSAGVIAAILPTAASAAGARTILVHTGDLNLASDAGRAALRQRVDGAVREVCQMTDWGSNLAAERADEACRTTALAAATVQADALVQAAQTNRIVVNRDVPVSGR